MLADVGIDTLQYAVQWNSGASGKRFHPGSTGQAYEYVEPDTRVRCKMIPPFCTEHMVFSRPDPASLKGISN